MADITALENRIRSLIKTNGNQEITGAVAQQILLDIADSLNTYLEAEAASRQSGDSMLSSGINTERQARIDADTALGERVTVEIQAEATARQNAIQQEAQRAEAAFDDLDMIDAAGSALQPTQITLTLRKNDGSEEDPDWRTLAELVIPSATTLRAGLLSAADKQKLDLSNRHKSYNYTKNDYTNSLVKEIHIEGTKDSNLKYFIRGCQRFNANNKFYFAIQSYNPSTAERLTICEFSDIEHSGLYTKTAGNYTVAILVILDNQISNSGAIFQAPYSEALEINDNCWGDIENAPIIKALTTSTSVNADDSKAVRSNAVYHAFKNTSDGCLDFIIYNLNKYATGGATITGDFITDIALIPLAERKIPCIVLCMPSNAQTWQMWIYRGQYASSSAADEYWLNPEFWTRIVDNIYLQSLLSAITVENNRHKSYNYTKNDYTNSLVKEIHIEGTKDSNLKYFVRGCQRFRAGGDEKFYFAIQSYNSSTAERLTICEFIGIEHSGLYKQTVNNNTTSILVILDNQNSNSGALISVPYSEQYEINDNCWGDIENAPIIKNINVITNIYLRFSSIFSNSLSPNVEYDYVLTDGYWNGNSGITQSPGYKCTNTLIPIIPGIKITFYKFLLANESDSNAVGWLYDSNSRAIGSRINKQHLTVENAANNIYSLTINNTHAAYIGLETRNPNPGKILLSYPISLTPVGKTIIKTEVNKIETKHVDLIMFMGQSNMAGRGITNSSHPDAAPEVLEGSGYEFRAISDPTKLYPIVEPFGVAENKPGGINDGNSKTGSMVSAFINAYYKTTGKVIVGVSASKGGTRSLLWLPTGILLPDAIQRLTDAVSYLSSNGYIIDHKYMAWCQGESDGDNNVSKADYKTNFRTILDTMKSAGIEKCFIVRIGQLNDSGSTRYSDIIAAQTELCQEYDDCIMASTALTSFRERGLMKDQFHYYQDAYNMVGTYAGRNAGLYRIFGIGKPQYDSMTNELYFSNKDY